MLSTDIDFEALYRLAPTNMASGMLARQATAIRLFSSQLMGLRHGLARASTGPSNEPPNVDDIEQILQQRVQDLPVTDMANPYEKERQLCILCKYNIELNYKNTKLLSQFISPFTGRVYSKNITGLCRRQYTRLEECVRRSQSYGFLPFVHKPIEYLKDPQLFNPSSSFKRRR